MVVDASRNYSKIILKRFVLALGMCLVLSHCHYQNQKEIRAVLISHEHFDDIYVEPHLAIHPKNNSRLGVACIVFDETSDNQNKLGRIRTFLSSDGGSTWKSTFISPILEKHTGDPWILIDESDRIIVSSLGGMERTITLYYSDDWGDSWQSIALSKYGMRSFDHPIIRINHDYFNFFFKN